MRIQHRASLLFVLLILPVAMASAQDEDMVPDRPVDEWVVKGVGPYAGKIEPRIGGAVESEREKLRLDIGASVDLLKYRYGHQVSTIAGGYTRDRGALTFGADFFTWTRLRSSGGFKFPVEAVDYYFGVFGHWTHRDAGISDIRIRAAHISAHLVDGDPSFTNPEQRYITYSREFVDLMVGFNPMLISGSRSHGWELDGRKWSDGKIRLRPYAGAMWLFHTIPDTLGVITPYAGLDGHLQLLFGSFPVTVRAGYEARLNTELEPIGEHLFRFGLKLARWNTTGVLIEGSYYAGRSPYGQHFDTRENFFSIGFGIGM